MTVEKFSVPNRFTGAMHFTAEIECQPWSSPAIKLGLAVKWAVKAGADLRGADLSRADLSGAVLSGAFLCNADLGGADLRNADLSNADLRNADLSRADLSRADLSWADLRGADLRGAVLRNAVLRGAKVNAIVARATRSDGYEFVAFDTDRGVIIRAGCRTMTLSEYRAHVAEEYPGTSKAGETLRILDYIDACARDVAP